MKKIVIAFVLFFTSFETMAAVDRDRPIAYSSLPQPARDFVEMHFPDARALRTKVEKGIFSIEYEVTLSNGFSVEFDRKGRWKEVDGNGQTLPDAVIPPAILETLRKDFPDNAAIEISLDEGVYEITFDNGMEYEFEGSGKMVHFDD